ncbi:MAG TPA: GtrA family protein [Mycobacteriales bacterium]|nr:GtrA family protein [Mycobacteriales bacterium]
MVSRARSFYDAFRGLIHEVAKFGVVGAVAYVVTVAVSNALRFGPTRLGPITSLGVAMIIAATFSYFANRHWTWRHKERQGLAREYGLFIALSVVGFVLTEVPVGFSEYVLGLHSPLAYNVSGNLIGTGIGTVWRFWSFKRWVFLEPEPERSDDAAHEALV